MNKLLKIEFYKVRNYPVFWITFSLMIVLVALVSIMLASLNFKYSFFYESMGVDSSVYFQFPYVWNTVSWIAGFFSHFWSILIIILLGNEYNYRMMRQQLLSGMSRKELFLSKFQIILLLPLVLVLIIFAISLVCGLVYTENISYSLIFDNSYYLLSYYLQSVLLMLFASVIVYLVRSPGFSILLYFGYIIFESLLRGLLKFIDMTFSGSFEMYTLSYFFPYNSISSLTPRPSLSTAMTEHLHQQVQLTDNPLHFSMLWVMGVALVYGLLFVVLSMRMTRKSNF